MTPSSTSRFPPAQRRGIRPAMNLLLARPLSARSIPLVILLFSVGVLAANRLHHLLCLRIADVECVRYWPIGVFFPRIPPYIGFPSPVHILTGLAALVLFLVALSVLPRADYRPLLVSAFSGVLLLTTTLTHGWQFGLVRPSAAAPNVGPDYYQDALAITNPLAFISDFNVAQPDLSVHSRTHPPGAVLTFYLLQRLTRDPGMISIVIAGLAVGLTALFLRKLLSTEFDLRTVGRILFLFFLIPSVQIYYAATVDALLAPLIVGSCLALILESRWWLLVSVACLLLASFLSFGFVFVLPVLLAFDIWRFRAPWRTGVLFLSLVLFYVFLDALLRFSYPSSFLTAAHLENPQGFRLIAQPADYLMSRIEDVAEIAVFFGPFLLIMLVSGLAALKPRRPLTTLSALAIFNLFLVFLSGAYQTGETARGALFIYPFLILPVAERVARDDMTHMDYARLAGLVFLQTLLMQLVGDYWW